MRASMIDLLSLRDYNIGVHAPRSLSGRPYGKKAPKEEFQWSRSPSIARPIV